MENTAIPCFCQMPPTGVTAACSFGPQEGLADVDLGEVRGALTGLIGFGRVLVVYCRHSAGRRRDFLFWRGAPTA